MKDNDKKIKSKKILTDLLAGAGAGALSGLIVAPLATVSDIAGTNAKSPGDSFYNMKTKEIAKHLYRSGINKELLKRNDPKLYEKIMSSPELLKQDRSLSKTIGLLERSKKLTNTLSPIEKLYYGIKEFYGGQGLKSIKLVPQNAINLATFSLLSSLILNRLSKNDKK